MRGRPWSWITGRPRVADSLAGGLTIFFGLVSLTGPQRYFAPPLLPILVAAAVVQGVALWWRRAHPLAVMLVVVAATAVAVLIAPAHDGSSGPGLIFASYAVSVYAGQRFRLAVAAGAIFVVVVAVVLLAAGGFESARVLFPLGVPSLVAWMIGDYIRSRRKAFRDMMARHEQERAQAAEDERLRIARELHDVVAHNVSLMAIQAGAARVSGNSSPEAFESIERGARDTLAELNRLLGVLRKDDGNSPALAPQPTLEHLDSLLEPARAAGLVVTLRVTGERRPLPPAVELSAYRIVQEGITNVLKHANASRVEVAVDYGPSALSVAVSDNGSGPGRANDSTGHGLIGMRERVELFGGDLSTETSALGGFTVRATLPVKAQA